ncbi:MAG TPA: DsbA family protein [Stellaceae bacterium]|nr:DsbA family protein [Stellaceae bacterium]
MREIWFVLLAAFGLIAFPPAYAASPATPPAAAQAVLKLSQQDRILGNPAAPITIIEYASMSCPHCAHFQNEILPTIKKDWIDTGKAKLVLRDFPLDKPALHAAMIARCAPPDRFYAFADTFFSAQPQWVMAQDQRAALARLAKLGGMDGNAVNACLANKMLENQVLDSRLTAAKELGVDSTPTFFVNGTQFNGAPTVAQFEKLLSSVAKS